MARDGLQPPILADRDQFHFPEVVLMIVPEGDADTAPTLRPILDRLSGFAGQGKTPICPASGKATQPAITNDSPTNHEQSGSGKPSQGRRRQFGTVNEVRARLRSL
jgi:hypothetical protein